MSDKQLLHQWKETLSAKPASKETFRGMHLAVLHQASQQKLDGHLLYMRFEIDDFILCELKGKPKELTAFELPEKEEETLWLCMQFLGTLTFPTGSVSKPDTIFSFMAKTSNDGGYLLTVPPEKQWVLFLGIKGASRRKLLSEQPILQQQYDRESKNSTEAIAISNVERKRLQQFAATTFTPFTTVHHIALLLAELYTSYLLKMEEQQGKDEGLIQVYQQAVEYIRKNYMIEQLSLEKVAAACYCSVRTLTRAFRGRPASVTQSILLLRLHKSRELLRNHPEYTVEHIAAMFYFSDAKHFANQYKKCFHRTPREERKKWADKAI